MTRSTTSAGRESPRSARAVKEPKVIDQIHALSPGQEYLAPAVFPAPHTDAEDTTLHASSFDEITDVPIH